LKLSGFGADAFVGIHQTEPVLLLVMPVFRAALGSVSKQPKNPPFWIAPLGGSTRRPRILPAEAPFLHMPRFGVEPVHPALANSTLALQFTSVLENLPSKARLWRRTTKLRHSRPTVSNADM
jgi:hypothetical protein